MSMSVLVFCYAVYTDWHLVLSVCVLVTAGYYHYSSSWRQAGLYEYDIESFTFIQQICVKRLIHLGLKQLTGLMKVSLNH